mmetsp:Transcript_40772/g.104364  ORF Transcript_40772/g.104364 Transcript_40772/m.104364 type:complete len:320 (+) Transcript_40772:304-1263(+)
MAGSVLRGKMEEGDRLLKEATKLCSPSVISLRFKPDWEQAGPLLDRAAVAYRAARAWQAAVGAYERAATAQERMGSPWHAGKALEAAAACCQEAGDRVGVTAFTRRAAEAYSEAGRPATGAEALAKGARLLEEADPAGALALYEAALELHEEDVKDTRGQDIYRDATNHCLRSKQWARGAELLLRAGGMCEAAGARAGMSRAYLGAVVVQLYGGQVGPAWATYQDCLAVDSFASSDAAHAADRLFTAYRSGSASAVVAAVKGAPEFSHALDNAVARLAKKLPTGDIAAAAAALGGDVGALGGGPGAAAAQADFDEDDLT